MNLIDFVSQKEIKINLRNPVVGLVFAQATYFDFENYLENDKLPIRVTDLRGIDFDNVNHEVVLSDMNYKFFESIVNNDVFHNTRILDFQSVLDVDLEKQFFAMTFLVNDKTLVVAFRGTDATILGWKEDFNMSFSSEVPSQKASVEYLRRVMEKYNFPTYVVGHSKGGNLAMYSSSNIPDNLKDRIKRIYNYDGPGFSKVVSESDNYKSVISKSYKIIPNSSVIGMLMDSNEKEKIVASKQVSIFQHDTYSWVIGNDGNFKYKDKLTASAKHFSVVVDEWLKNTTKEERIKVVDIIYSKFSELGISNVNQLKKLFSIDGIKKLQELHKETDPEVREYVNGLTKMFVSIYVKKLGQ